MRLVFVCSKEEHVFRFISLAESPTNEPDDGGTILSFFFDQFSNKINFFILMLRKKS